MTEEHGMGGQVKIRVGGDFAQSRVGEKEENQIAHGQGLNLGLPGDVPKLFGIDRRQPGQEGQDLGGEGQTQLRRRRAFPQASIHDPVAAQMAFPAPTAHAGQEPGRALGQGLLDEVDSRVTQRGRRPFAARQEGERLGGRHALQEKVQDAQQPGLESRNDLHTDAVLPAGLGVQTTSSQNLAYEPWLHGVSLFMLAQG